MSFNSAVKIFLFAGAIILTGCAGLQYNKLSLDYPKNQSKEVFYKAKQNVEKREKVNLLDLQVLERSGTNYFETLKFAIPDYLDFSENKKDQFINSEKNKAQAARILEDAKVVDQTLSKYIDGYAARIKDLNELYNNSVKGLKSQCEAHLKDLVGKNNLLEAITISEKLEKLEFVSSTTTKEIVNRHARILVSQNSNPNEAFDQVLQIAKEQHQRFDEDTKVLVLNFIRSSITAKQETSGELAFKKIDLISLVLRDCQILKDDPTLARQREQLINRYARKMYVLKPVNSASTSIEEFTQKVLNKLQSEITVSDQLHCEVIGGEKIKSIYENAKIATSVNDLIPSDKNLTKGMSNSYILAIEVSKVVINKQPPQSREERVEAHAPGAGFRDGLAMGVSYNGDIQYFEYTVTTQEAFASVFASLIIYDLMENKIVLKDSVEFEKTFKSTSKSSIMACGQDKVRIGSSYNYTGVGPIKKIPAGYVPSHVQSQYRVSGDEDLPSSDGIKSVIFDNLASQVSEKTKRSLRGD